MNKTLIVVALAGIFMAGTASAHDQRPASQKTKCYGLDKTGETEWKLAYPATCVKQGGSLTPPAKK